MFARALRYTTLAFLSLGLAACDGGCANDADPSPAGPLQVQCTGSPTAGPAPLTVSFMAAPTNADDSRPTTYLWTFGDGAQSTNPVVSHTYAAPGSYRATVTVTNGPSRTGSCSVTITVGGALRG
jgi:PKD repeat protein